MAIKVHGAMLSTAAQRVLACLHEKGIDYVFVPVDMKAGEHKKEPFLSINPFGQVPGFEDGDLKLFGKLRDKGTPLVFHDPKKMAIVSVWMEVEAHRFDSSAGKLTWELAAKPFLGMATDDAVVEEQECQLTKVLDVYESRLAESKYLCGDTFTLADLHHLPALSYLMGTRTKAIFEARPHFRAWCEDILARPAWQKVIAMKKSQ